MVDKVIVVERGRVRLEREREGAALVDAFREDLYRALVHADQVLTDHQAHANAFAVHVGGSE